MTKSVPDAAPTVPPARAGHRRWFSEADKRRIVAEAIAPGANLSEVARGYGIAARVVFRWKQELSLKQELATAVTFVNVEIVDAPAAAEEVAP